MKKILFVCTGNTCRSPMAEAVACKLIKDHKYKNIEVGSAGVAVNADSEMEQNAKHALRIIGINNFEHKPRQFEREMISEYGLILTMTKEQRDLIGSFPNVLTVEDFTGLEEIADPYGQPLEFYAETLSVIVRVVDILLQKICVALNDDIIYHIYNPNTDHVYIDFSETDADEKEAGLRRNLMEAIEQSEVNTVGKNKDVKVDENKVNMNSVDASFRRNLLDAIERSEVNNAGKNKDTKVDENNVNMNSVDAGLRRNLMEALKQSSAESSAKGKKADKSSTEEKNTGISNFSSNFKVNLIGELKELDSKSYKKSSKK